MSISVISSGFIGIPYFITFQGAKQGSIAATIKLTRYPRAGERELALIFYRPPIARFRSRSTAVVKLTPIEKSPGRGRGLDLLGSGEREN